MHISRVRRIVWMLAWMGLALAAAGCWDRHEIETLAVASAVGFDVAPGGEGILMTGVFAIPSRVTGAAAGTGGAGGPGGGPTEPFARTSAGPRGPTAWVVSAPGTTLEMAMERLATLSPRLPFWAQVRVIVIGDSLARRGLRTLLTGLIRHREFRRVPWLVVAKDLPAYRLLELPSPLNASGPEGLARLQSVLQFGSALTMPQRLQDFLADYVEPGTDPVAPAFSFELPRQPDPGLLPSGAAGAGPTSGPRLPALPAAAGTAVFQDDRLVGWLTPDESRALLLMRGRSRPFGLSAPCPGGRGEAAVRVVRFTTRRGVEELPGRRPRFSVRVVAEAELIEQGCERSLNRAGLQRLEDILGRRLERELRVTLERLHRQMRADAAGFGLQLYREHPALWGALAHRWRQELPRLDVKASVRVQIRRTGLASGQVESAP